MAVTVFYARSRMGIILIYIHLVHSVSLSAVYCQAECLLLFWERKICMYVAITRRTGL
jgi:hypothetical protein